MSCNPAGLYLLLSAACAALAAGAPGDKAKGDREKLQGTWAGRLAPGGRPGIAGADADYTLTFDGDNVALSINGQVFIKGTFSIDESKLPRTIDVMVSSGGGVAGKTSLGIYAFDGDTLKYCSGKAGSSDRPQEFKTGSGFTWLVLRRTDAETAKPPK